MQSGSSYAKVQVDYTIIRTETMQKSDEDFQNVLVITNLNDQENVMAYNQVLQCVLNCHGQ